MSSPAARGLSPARPTRNGRPTMTSTTMEGRTRWLALIVLCLGTLMIVLDTTIVNVALPSIRTTSASRRPRSRGS